MSTIDIGEEQPAKFVEPIEDPFKRERDVPREDPAEPIHAPEREPAKTGSRVSVNLDR